MSNTKEPLVSSYQQHQAPSSLDSLVLQGYDASVQQQQAPQAGYNPPTYDSAAQQEYAPQAGYGSNPYQQPQAMQETYGGPAPMPESSNDPEEAKWLDVFANYTAWWDNRESKRNPRQPDFSHKETREALWLTNNPRLPPWVMAKIKELPPPPPPRM